MLFDGSTTSEKGDKEDDTANNYQKDGCVEERAAKEVQVVAVDPLDNTSSYDQGQSRDGKYQIESKEEVLDAFHAAVHDEGSTRKVQASCYTKHFLPKTI